MLPKIWPEITSGTVGFGQCEQYIDEVVVTVLPRLLLIDRDLDLTPAMKVHIHVEMVVLTCNTLDSEIRGF